MKFTVVSDSGKKFEFDWHTNETWINERNVTVGLLYLDGGLFATGVAVCHPNDWIRTHRGNRLALSRAVAQGFMNFVHPITFQVTIKQVKDAWKAATGKAYREAHG